MPPPKDPRAVAGRYRQRVGVSYHVTDRDIYRLMSDPCRYCGAPATDTDHALALARGGRHSIGNMVPACHRCNAAKQTKTITEFRHAYGVLGRLDALIEWPADTRDSWQADQANSFLLNPGQCPGCGQQLVQPKMGRRRRYCSDRCRRDGHMRRHASDSGHESWAETALAAGWTPPRQPARHR